MRRQKAAPHGALELGDILRPKSLARLFGAAPPVASTTLVLSTHVLHLPQMPCMLVSSASR